MEASHDVYGGSVLYGEEVVVARLGGVVREIEQGVLPCETENRVQCTRYWSVMEANRRVHGSSVLDGKDVVVAGLGGVDREIEWGGGFCPVKPKTEHCTLGIGL